MEIGQRRALFVLDVPPTPHAARRSTRDQNRKVLVVVQTRVTHPASVQVDSVVQQRSVAVWCGLQFLEELREEQHVERIDLCNLRELVGTVAVMTRGMVWVGNADLGIRAVTQLASELEGHHPRDVC